MQPFIPLGIHIYTNTILETEKDIIRGCKSGSEYYFKVLYDRYKGKLMGICLRYCNNREQAHDALQESFIAIILSIKNFNGAGTFEGWITRVTINTTLRIGRKWDFKKADIEIETLELPSQEIDPNQQLSYNQLLNLIQRLPHGYRLVFNLYVLDGYTHKEIAKLLNISIGTSKSQLARAKNKLATWLIKMEYEGLVLKNDSL